MRRIRLVATLLALTGCLWLGRAAAQDRGKADTDRDFVMKASAAGLAEVNLGSMAAKQATNADVKKFGQNVVADHNKVNRELLRIADRKRFTPARAMDDTHRQLANRLAQLRGADFDRQFMGQIVKDHKEAIALFENEAKNGNDKDLKEFASKTLPALREHLKMAESLDSKFRTNR